MTDAFDLEMMRLALEIATRSPDPSTQNGAVLVNRFGVNLGSGCNEFPPRVQYLPERWERPIKYSYIEHAERGAIFDAARNGGGTHVSTMYCPWFACADCARAIICAGVSRVVGLNIPGLGSDGFPNAEIQARWEDSIDAGMVMLREAAIVTEYLNPSEPFNITILRGGEKINL